MEEILHALSITFIIVASSLGIGLGCSMAGTAAIQALDIAPATKNDVLKIILFALALIETGGIISLILALLLIFGTAPTNVAGIAELGIALAMGISSFAVGLAAALPAKAAVYALARQPFFGNKILNIMLLSQSIVQTPVIFGFLISLIIKANIAGLADFANAYRFLIAGAAMGVGGIGPAISLGLFSKNALRSLGINRLSYNKILPFTFISQAMIETPVIFVMLIALIICIRPMRVDTATTLIAYLAAAFSVAISTIAPSLGVSRIASSASLQMSYKPEHATVISRVGIISQGLVDSAAIYGLLIALLLVLFS